ncbi:26230_t:CDS:2, partial [Gigaspora rosea]
RADLSAPKVRDKLQVARVKALAPRKKKFVKVDMEEQQAKRVKTCEAKPRNTAECVEMISIKKGIKKNGHVLMRGLSSGALDAVSKVEQTLQSWSMLKKTH